MQFNKLNENYSKESSAYMYYIIHAELYNIYYLLVERNLCHLFKC